MHFVNQSPLFQSLAPAIKNLLKESLKPHKIQFGNRFVKQGSVCNSLYFICQGWVIQYEATIANEKVKEKSGRRTACSERVGHSRAKLDPSKVALSHRDLTIRQRRCPRKRRSKINFPSFHFFSRLFQGAQLLKRREFSLELKRRDRVRVLTEPDGRIYCLAIPLQIGHFTSYLCKD